MQILCILNMISFDQHGFVHFAILTKLSGTVKHQAEVHVLIVKHRLQTGGDFSVLAVHYYDIDRKGLYIEYVYCW